MAPTLQLWGYSTEPLFSHTFGPRAHTPHQCGMMAYVFYTVIIPMLNLVIYSHRNMEVKWEVRQRFSNQKYPTCCF
ncbi:hypothetical protein JRQ81_003713 [Phrynocephalus forsythii]|uniref:Uncharacterized protein n=1 Tax=Phrynocephalus forsythii TaxID=171643 RepID=A0A9Q1AXG5_9SAUR|nr:hypothetical protein JRQ81_003713 [Phrynocephalus forsythii]